MEEQKGAKETKRSYSSKVKFKKKIASIIMNVSKEYLMSEENVRKNNATKEIPKTINQRRLTKKKMVSNQ